MTIFKQSQTETRGSEVRRRECGKLMSRATIAGTRPTTSARTFNDAYVVRTSRTCRRDVPALPLSPRGIVPGRFYGIDDSTHAGSFEKCSLFAGRTAVAEIARISVRERWWPFRARVFSAGIARRDIIIARNAWPSSSPSSRSAESRLTGPDGSPVVLARCSARFPAFVKNRPQVPQAGHREPSCRFVRLLSIENHGIEDCYVMDSVSPSLSRDTCIFRS